MPILFAVTLFVSALLLFMVQPMIGRMILPLLGGSPAAWNTCMVFFQFTLLLGYLYAHKLCGRLSPRHQVAVHLGVLGAAAITFLAAVQFGERGTPIAIVKSLAPQNTAYPMFGVMALLAIAIGVPFFAVSASAPMLQKWFSNTTHPAAKDPYFLYAASNLGSLLSLLAYPLVTEPSFTLNQQSWLFAGGFAVLGVLVFICGRAALKMQAPAAINNVPLADGADAPSWWRIGKWIAYAFVPSSLMLGVTFYMTTDIASIPLLWVIPLALYLLTFIIAFMATPPWLRIVLGNLAPVMTLLLIFFIVTMESLENVSLLISLHLLVYFLLALMCHSELARDRPPARYLTNFYLWISVGGMLGGVFNAILAPIIFPRDYEYSIALTLGCMMVPKLSEPKERSPDRAAWGIVLDFLIPFAMLTAVAYMTVYVGELWMIQSFKWISKSLTDAFQFMNVNFFLSWVKVKYLFNWALPLVLCFLAIDRPVRFGLCVAAVFGVGEFRRANMVLHTERSFFGILKVRDDPPDLLPLRNLVHGTTLHGKQGLDPWPLNYMNQNALSALIGPGLVYGTDWRLEPLTYYHRTGPVGHAFTVTRERNPKPRVAMVGLGTGSVACYADKNLALTFYEIDPTVKGLVADRKRDAAYWQRRQNVDEKGNSLFDPKRDPFFTYVIDAEERGADIQFVLGDARLELEEEEARGAATKYDLLLVDAFSSDSIPVHLLTKEAVELYMRRLTLNGLLALHISNKFVKLEYVVAAIAKDLGLAAKTFNDTWHENEDDDDDLRNQYYPPGKTQSQWVILARDAKLLEIFEEPRFSTSYRFTHNVRNEDGKLLLRELPVNVWEPVKGHAGVKPWTDDYADVLMVMMLKEVQWARRQLGLPHLGPEDTR